MYMGKMAYDGFLVDTVGYGYNPIKVAMRLWKSDESLAEKCLYSLLVPLSPVAWVLGNLAYLKSTVEFEIELSRFMKKADAGTMDLLKLLQFAETMLVAPEIKIRLRLRRIANLGERIVPQLVEIATGDAISHALRTLDPKRDNSFFLLSEIGRPAFPALAGIVSRNSDKDDRDCAANAIREMGPEVLPDIHAIMRNGDGADRLLWMEIAGEIAKNGGKRLRLGKIGKLNISDLDLKHSFVRQRGRRANGAPPSLAGPNSQDAPAVKKVRLL